MIFDIDISCRGKRSARLFLVLVRLAAGVRTAMNFFLQFAQTNQTIQVSAIRDLKNEIITLAFKTKKGASVPVLHVPSAF